ncbi:hypothetical protein DRQ09_03515 [candidate division KSB1 bacterium]|nr:MAG: hypothetical protein DRQ09_03515 [candidate division KSB1 bacterium]
MALLLLSANLKAQLHHRYIFVDDSIIQKTYQVTRVVHHPEKCSQNPLLIADKPWEGGINLYGTVLYDNGKFRMWYQVYNGKAKDRSFNTLIAYAESEDGIHWTKPDLGLVEFEGNKNNNILITCRGTSSLYSPAVVKDPKPENPEKTYKMIYWDSMSKKELEKYGPNFPPGKNVPGWRAIPGEGFFTAYSPDGIHWKQYGHQPVFTCACDASSLNYFSDGTFVVFHKISVAEDRHFRILGQTTSKDFVNWSKPSIILEPDWHDPYGTEFYGMSGFEYYGNYLGLVWIYNNAPADKSMNIQMAASKDGKNWHRAADRKIFLDRGEPGDWDGGSIVVSSNPLISPPGYPDKILIYYGGGTTTHDDSRYREWGIGLATLRIDGFVSMRSGMFNGKLKTKPIIATGSKMFCNCDIKHGYIKIELLDENGKSIAMSKDITTSGTRKIVQWEKSPKVDIAGKKITIVFYMKKSDLYSFWFE